MSEQTHFKIHLRFVDRVGIVADVAAVVARIDANISAMEVERQAQWADLYLHLETTVGMDADKLIAAVSDIEGLADAHPIRSLPREKRANRFRVVLDTASDGILSVDTAGRITTINQVAQDLLDCNDKRMLGAPLDKLVADAPLHRCLQGETYTNQRRHLVTRQGRISFLATGKPILDPDGRVVGAVEILKAMAEATAMAAAVAQPSEVTFSDIQGRSPEIQSAIAFAQKIAHTDAIVSIRGESGTGKDLIARAIHAESGRPGPFVPVNCAALPETLLESELFGYVGGAFTGARRKGRPGLFELADGGTVFLDEIGELPSGPQAKILRLIQDSRVRRVGANREIAVNARIITATNQDLEAMVAAGRFRRDLYYRINVLPIQIPPLTERPEDVRLLATYFLAEINARLEKPDQTLSPEALARIMAHDWPGNVRELKNVISRAAILCDDDIIGVVHIRLSHDLSPSGRSARVATPNQPHLPLAAQIAPVEKSILTDILGRSSSIRKAARKLGISHTALRNKMKKHGIQMAK